MDWVAAVTRHLSIGKCLLVVVAIFVLFNAAAHSWAGIEPDAEAWATKSLIVIKSTTSFRAAKAAAIQAAERLGVRLDLRGLAESQKIGLTFPKVVCDANGYSYPCYVSRSRYDDGLYVSVEYSNVYEGLTRGLYLVILASGGVDELQPALALGRRSYPDAHVQTTKVYVEWVH